MYEIRNKIDLRIAYEILLDVMERNNAKYDDRIIALKRNIRAYNNKPIEPKPICIYEDCYGYYTMLCPFPDFIDNVEDAEEYFEECMRLEYVPSMYDCTGQHFTTGHKIFWRRGKLYVYHNIAVDC